jgi:hypothetical protein
VREPARLVAFNGPILSDLDQSVGDARLPNSFFKVVIWREGGDLRSVGFILMPAEAPASEAAGQSRHDVHQQSLAEIEKVTRIDFGRDVLAADMLAHLGERGAGAAGPITAASDLRFG